MHAEGLPKKELGPRLQEPEGPAEAPLQIAGHGLVKLITHLTDSIRQLTHWPGLETAWPDKQDRFIEEQDFSIATTKLAGLRPTSINW